MHNENVSLDVWLDKIRGKIEMASIEDKMRYARLRRFGHINRTSIDAQ